MTSLFCVGQLLPGMGPADEKPEASVRGSEFPFVSGCQLEIVSGLGTGLCPLLSALGPPQTQSHAGPVHAASLRELSCASFGPTVFRRPCFFVFSVPSGSYCPSTSFP